MPQLLLLLLLLLLQSVVVDGRPRKLEIGGNYHWAAKIIGRNDPHNHSDAGNVHLAFEVGSRDLLDGNFLAKWYGCDVFSFEADAKNHRAMLSNNLDKRVRPVHSAVTTTDGAVSFFSVNQSRYNNTGMGSLMLLDFKTNRSPNDADYNKSAADIQYEVRVPSTRLDSFILKNGLRAPDLLCIDAQEAELAVLQSAGDFLGAVKYVVVEVTTAPQYSGGASLQMIHTFLTTGKHGDFTFVALRYQFGKGNIVFQYPEAPAFGGADVLYKNRRLN